MLIGDYKLHSVQLVIPGWVVCKVEPIHTEMGDYKLHSVQLVIPYKEITKSKPILTDLFYSQSASD